MRKVLTSSLISCLFDKKGRILFKEKEKMTETVQK